jgi:hypothetical protein
VVLSTAPAFPGSIDFGGSVLNSSGLGNYPNPGAAGASAAFAQRNVGSLWFQAAFDDFLLFNAQIGSAFTTYAYGTPPQLFYVDADLFNLQGTFPTPQEGLALFRFTLGRAPFSDFTGLVLNHKADGFLFEFQYPDSALTFSAAYTGLVSKGASTITLSKADIADVSNASVIFAPPRLVEMVSFSVFSLLGQKVTLSAIFQEDMRDTVLDLASPGTSNIVTAGSTTFDAAKGGGVNTQYAGLGMSGTIVSALYYDVYSYLEALQELAFSGGAYKSTTSFGLMAGGSLRYYANNLLFSVFGARIIYVSGDPASTTTYEGNVGQFSAFAPISRPTLSSVFSPQLTNILLAEASYSLKPLSFLGSDIASSVEVRILADVYFRPTPGAISEPGIPAGNTDLYLGTESDVSVNFRPLSDVTLSLWGGLFFPGAAFGPSPAMQYKSGLDIALAF